MMAVLSAILAGCFWYCFSRTGARSPAETPSPSLIFDYVLYLGSLTWSVELGYLENGFELGSDILMQGIVLLSFRTLRGPAQTTGPHTTTSISPD